MLGPEAHTALRREKAEGLFFAFPRYHEFELGIVEEAPKSSATSVRDFMTLKCVPNFPRRADDRNDRARLGLLLSTCGRMLRSLLLQSQRNA